MCMILKDSSRATAIGRKDILLNRLFLGSKKTSGNTLSFKDRFKLSRAAIAKKDHNKQKACSLTLNLCLAFLKCSVNFLSATFLYIYMYFV